MHVTTTEAAFLMHAVRIATATIDTEDGDDSHVKVELRKVTIEFPSGDIEEYTEVDSNFISTSREGKPVTYYSITIPID